MLPTEPKNKTFLGRGWSMPVALFSGSQEPGAVPESDIAMAAAEEDIRQAVLLILETNPGERVMRPDFGAGLQALIFEPLNTTTMALARHRVEQALITWEPRIDQITVNVTADPPVGRMDIEVRYRVRATNTFYNLVYPFYTQEGRT